MGIRNKKLGNVINFGFSSFDFQVWGGKKGKKPRGGGGGLYTVRSPHELERTLSLSIYPKKLQFAAYGQLVLLYMKTALEVLANSSV